jgi:hypothetical protein
MNPIKFVFFLLLLAALTSACGAPQAAPLPSPSPSPLPPTATPMPAATFTPLPTQTDTPEPTAKATIIPTDTPVGQIFRDDFNGSLQPGWQWQSENPARWKISSDGWLEILGEDATLLGDGYQSNLLCREAPQGDFQFTVHLSAQTTDNFQQAALYIFKDADNYLTFNRGYCSFCPSGGNGFYLDYKYAGQIGTYSIIATSPDVYLRFLSQGHSITGYYAYDPAKWQRLGSVGNFLEQYKICLGVSNADHAGLNADLLGRFDYVEIIRP